MARALTYRSFYTQPIRCTISAKITRSETFDLTLLSDDEYEDFKYLYWKNENDNASLTDQEFFYFQGLFAKTEFGPSKSYVNEPDNVREVVQLADQDQAPERLTWWAELLTGGARLDPDEAHAWLEAYATALEAQQTHHHTKRPPKGPGASK